MLEAIWEIERVPLGDIIPRKNGSPIILTRILDVKGKSVEP